MTIPALMNTCPICAGPVTQAFTGRVLGRHDTGYFHCAGCGLLRTAPPTWLAEAYTSAIASTDTGLVARNLAMARTMAVVLSCLPAATGPLVDVAGGHGLFTRLMRDYGFDVRWDDLYAHNLLAPGHEAADLAASNMITAFEVLEHVHDPIAFLEQLQQRWHFRILFFTTETYSGALPPPLSAWRYYSLETGQHVCFFQERTLDALAARFGLRHRRLGPLHVFAPAGTIPWYLPFLCGRLTRILAPVLRRGRSLVLSDHAAQVQKLTSSANAESCSTSSPQSSA